MSILSHPRHPRDRNHVLLADFVTGSAVLRRDHIEWLQEHAVPALRRRPAHWVYIRGFASRLDDADYNLELSNQRAHAVHAWLAEQPGVDMDHITGIDARGEQWSTGDERDNSPQWRSVEIIITPNRRPVRRRLRPPPRPPMADRVVRRRILIKEEPQRAFRQRGEDAYQFGQFLRQHTLDPEARRQEAELRSMPASHRVNAISVTITDDGSNPFVSFSWYQIEYDWGPPEPTVRLEHAGVHSISRARADEWLEHPGRILFWPGSEH